jgi:chromosome segregation ATPase
MTEEKEPTKIDFWSELQKQRAMQDVDAYNRLLGEILTSSSLALKQTSDTDDTLTGTIHSLATRLESIETSIGLVTGSAQALSSQFGGQISDQIETSIAPVRAELMSIKQEVLPELDSTKRTLKSLEEFLRNNAAFLATAVEAQGLLPALQGEIGSLNRRLDAVESTVNKAWDRRLTVLSLVVAVISIAVATYAVISR